MESRDLYERVANVNMMINLVEWLEYTYFFKSNLGNVLFDTLLKYIQSMWYYIHSTIFLKLNVEVRSTPLQNLAADGWIFLSSFKISNALWSN